MATGGRTEGTAGASARSEHERRRAQRERRARQRHGPLAGLLLALAGAPEHERRWARGAEGEERVAVALERCRPEVALLHDRAVPGSRANIDHLVVAPSGVWVVDAKRYAGRVRVRRPLLGPATLRIGGRDRTALVAGVLRQAELVARVVHAHVPSAAVRGAVCFVDGDLPLLGVPTVDGVAVLHRRALRRCLDADGPLRPEHVTALAAVLAERFPPAA